MGDLRMWFTLVISGAFTAVAVAMLWIEPAAWRQALAIGSFFGLCLVVAAGSLVAKVSVRRSLASPATVSVAGGVPIAMRHRPLWCTAGALVIVGGFGILGGARIAALYPWLSGFIALIGVGLAAGLVTGRIASRRLRFAPDGLWIDQRCWRYRFPWDGLHAVLGEVNDNVVVWLLVEDLAPVLESVALTADGTAPPTRDAARAIARAREQVRRELSRVGGRAADGAAEETVTAGGGLLLFPAQFGLDGVRLCEAVARYSQDPASRQELRSALPPASATAG